MPDDPPTGPWILALGTLAIGVAAVATELVRRRDGDSTPDEPDNGAE